MRNHRRRELRSCLAGDSQSSQSRDERFTRYEELEPEERLRRVAILLLKAIRLKMGSWIAEQDRLGESPSPNGD